MIHTRKGGPGTNAKHYEALVELMSAVGSSQDLDEVLNLATATAARVAGCDGGFLYLWNPQLERLVLSATTRGGEKWIQTVHLGLGEGVVGWVAQHGEVVIVKENVVTDPRFKMISGLDQETTHSGLVVPVTTTRGELVGIFALRSASSRTFNRACLDFTSHVATLLAGMIEKARLYRDMEAELAVLGDVARLSQALSAHHQIDEVIRAVTDITCSVMRTDACATWLVDGDRLRLQSVTPGFASGRMPRRDFLLDTVLSQWLSTTRVTTGQPEDLPLPLRQAIPQHFDYWMAAPMGLDSDTGGFTLVLRDRLVFVDQELSLMSTIANQAAVAISRARLIQQLSDKERVTAFFDVLFSPGGCRSASSLIERGRMLGVDLEQPHLVAAARLAPSQGKKLIADEEAIWPELQRRLDDLLPGSLGLCRDNLFCILIPATEGMEAILERLKVAKQDAQQHLSVKIAMGVGNPCESSEDYPQGLAEATEALRIGESLLWDRAQIVLFRELGIYHYLYEIWEHEGDVRDHQQEMLVELLEYDRTRGTDLLLTLERYLECLGHVGETARKLYIHRNSLRNRLQKISNFLEIDVTDRSCWFPLYLALQIVRIRDAARQAITSPANTASRKPGVRPGIQSAVALVAGRPARRAGFQVARRRFTHAAPQSLPAPLLLCPSPEIADVQAAQR